jgi:hypothetical protein
VKPRQFTIAQVLFWTTCAATICGLSRLRHGNTWEAMAVDLLCLIAMANVAAMLVVEPSRFISAR